MVEREHRTSDRCLDALLLHFSDTDPWTALDACEGTVVFGAPGSGKTSTSGRRIAMSFITPGVASAAGLGGLVLTAKGEETETWINYVKEVGREDDLILFSATSGHHFDPLFYEWNRPGRGAADLENIIELFTTLLAIGRPQNNSSADRFWEFANEQLMRNVITLLALAKQPISIVSINDVIESLPVRPFEFETEEWQSTSRCAEVINLIRDRKDELTSGQWGDLDIASRYACRTWAEMDDRPRSSIYMTWAGMASRFAFHPYRELFCAGQCSFIPEQTTREGKIVIVDFPYLQFGMTGQLINCLLKLVFQRAWLRRDTSVDPEVCFLWADEAQYFMLPNGKDNLFQQTCRSARVATVWLTQNILNLSEQHGEHIPGSKTKSWLANMMVKIFHQQSCPETNNYAAEIIGREYRYLGNFGGNSMGGSEQRVYRVEPHLFSRLQKPGPHQPTAHAIVFRGGTVFEATRTDENPKGLPYLPIEVSR